jgi:hypothetical protein
MSDFTGASCRYFDVNNAVHMVSAAANDSRWAARGGDTLTRPGAQSSSQQPLGDARLKDLRWSTAALNSS